jgi:putative hemolysin
MQTAIRLPIRKVIMNELTRWVDLQKARKFEPKINLKITCGRFEIRTVQTWEELKEVLRLRYDVFFKEGLGREDIGYDVDKYDLHADHLVITEKNTDKIVGTYRLLCSKYTDDFYSKSEFDLSGFFYENAGVYLELGRACVHKDYRNGTTLHMLWKGLSAYMNAVDADYLFGCASVKTTSPMQTAGLLHYLQNRGFLSDKYGIRPIEEYTMPGLETCFHFSQEQDYEQEDLLPALVQSYIAAGAYVYGRPALDRAFKCIDLFTILKIKDITPRYKSKYFTKRELSLVPLQESQDSLA